MVNKRWYLDRVKASWQGVAVCGDRRRLVRRSEQAIRHAIGCPQRLTFLQISMTTLLAV